MPLRKPNRLKIYDYSQPGCYFITICTGKHEHLFGEINNGKMILNDYGMIAYNMWEGLSRVFKNVATDAFVVMPNHVHGIIIITENIPKIPVGNATSQTILKENNSHYKIKNALQQNCKELHSLQEPGYKRTKMYISKVIQAYKAEVSRRIKRNPGKNIIENVWQKSFYDRIIRTEKEFFQIQVYISENPVRWQNDIENISNKYADSKYMKIFLNNTCIIVFN